MSERPVLRLGTRGSALARAQAREVAARLERAHARRGLRVELVEIATTGDADRASALRSFGGTGVFVKELQRALLEGRVDLAVHSLKDLPIARVPGLARPLAPRREDPRDAAVLRAVDSLDALPRGATVGTGSPRRRAQLAERHAGLNFAEIRGNVETRLRKVAEGQCDATILAVAGLRRLGLLPAGDLPRVVALDFSGQRLCVEILTSRAMLPAPGQGALALETRSADARTRRWVRVLHDRATALAVSAERACLAALGGGCHLPLGALGTVNRKTGTLRLEAVLPRAGGAGLARVVVSGPAASALRLGRRAAELLLEEKAYVRERWPR